MFSLLSHVQFAGLVKESNLLLLGLLCVGGLVVGYAVSHDSDQQSFAARHQWLCEGAGVVVGAVLGVAVLAALF